MINFLIYFSYLVVPCNYLSDTRNIVYLKEYKWNELQPEGKSLFKLLFEILNV